MYSNTSPHSDFMLEPLVKLCKELFPAIADETHEAAEKAIREIHETSKNYSLISRPLENVQLAQGDIFSGIPFCYINQNGSMSKQELEGMLLTNTCDNQRRDNLLFSPLRRISDLFPDDSTMAKRLKENGYYYLFYLNEQGISDKFVDFNQVMSINRERFVKRLEDSTVSRLCSLSQIGYYVFITKLTIFFMRYEDKDVNGNRFI